MSDVTQNQPPGPQHWDVKPAFDWKTVLAVVAAFALLSVSAHRMELHRLSTQLGELLQASVGLKESSQVGRGIGSVAQQMYPLAIAERTPVSLIDHFEPDDLPLFSRLETDTVEESALDAETMQMTTRVVEKTYLVEPVGYLTFTLGKMLETVEMAVWASLFAVLLSLPLAWVAARNFTPHLVLYGLARSFVSFLRAVPELISALFLVLAFGFGPIAGILALALHSVGFLAKFFAEDIEAADKAPQDAIRATGAGDLAVLRLAVLPQVLPSYTALTFYILDRNIRMGTVIGLVGAGGIGQELKGRYDMFQYDHVATILLIIFLSVLALDALAAKLRRKLI
ncbi:MAG: phosphonate ABC transporter, permease protein PhnE [Hyphomonas sp.]|nr:phosphonate ABC transporter, permease protein PhnE [Hyphomonas sp.]